MARKILDCRKHPSESGCDITIAGREDDVLDLGAKHAADRHGIPETPENREKLRSLLSDEV